MQDAFLKRLAEDTVLYVRTVCNTIIMEVPKAIVHCQVRLLLATASHATHAPAAVWYLAGRENRACTGTGVTARFRRLLPCCVHSSAAT